VVSPLWLKRGAGVLFLMLGVLFLFSSKGSPDASETGSSSSAQG
jgi:hypothetical protein